MSFCGSNRVCVCIVYMCMYVCILHVWAISLLGLGMRSKGHVTLPVIFLILQTLPLIQGEGFHFLPFGIPQHSWFRGHSSNCVPVKQASTGKTQADSWENCCLVLSPRLPLSHCWTAPWLQGGQALLPPMSGGRNLGKQNSPVVGRLSLALDRIGVMAGSGSRPWRVGWLVQSPLNWIGASLSDGYDTCGLYGAIMASLGQSPVEAWRSDAVAEVNRSIHSSFYLFTQHSYWALFHAGHWVDHEVYGCTTPQPIMPQTFQRPETLFLPTESLCLNPLRMAWWNFLWLSP